MNDAVEKLGLRVLTSQAPGDTELTGGYTCDLLSDVMANGRPGNLWITMQTHQNVLAVVRLKDLAGIVVVNGRQPDEETIQKADQENVTVLGTDQSAFQVSGRLHRLLEES
jgi:predicted transcriptional regulator